MEEIVEKLRVARNQEEIFKILDNVNEFSEVIRLLNDQDKIRLSRYIRSSSIASKFIECVEDDKLKLEEIEQRIKEKPYENQCFDYTNAIKKLNSDEAKLNFLKKYMDKYREYGRTDYLKIIKNINSDEMKLDLLGSFSFSDLEYSGIISTLKSDENKIEAMNLFLVIKDKNIHCYSDIISSFNSDKIRMDYINSPYMGSPKEEDIKKIIENIKSNSNKIELLGKFTHTFMPNIEEILNDMKFESDEDRLITVVMLKKLSICDMKCIRNILSELKIENIEDIKKAINLINDNSILEYVSNFSDETFKNKVKDYKYEVEKDIISIEIIEKIELTDAEKIELLDYINGDFSKIKIITMLYDDKIKIEQLEKLSNESEKAEVIITLQSDETKIKELEKLNDETIKAKVISKLADDKIKIEQLEKLNDETIKAEVIITLEDEELKIEELEKLSDELAKAKVISKLTDDKIKIEQLEKLSDELAKAEVIITLEDEELKIEELEKLSDELAKVKVLMELKDINSIKQSILKLMQADQNEMSIENLLTDREKLSEILLDENRVYTKIGLDEKITIGMEIESEGIMSKIIEEIVKYEVDGNIIGWEAKGDGSLDSGVEVVSPVLTDNKKDIEEIYIICEMMQRLKQKTTENCGGHIHIGADYLKSKEAYINLFEIWGNAEKIISKISNEKGTIPRMGIINYATPISKKLNEAIERGTINLENEEDLEQFIGNVQAIQEERYSGLNLLNINNGINTIEFRIPNGTINADTWIENARLFGRIVQISQKLSEIEKKTELSEEDKKLLELKNDLKDEISEQDKMEILLELLFSEEEKTVYRERYICSSRLLEQVSSEKNPFQQTEFSRVDFKKKKHLVEEFKEVASSERISRIEEVVLETVEGANLKEKTEKTNIKNMEE